jgi:hypothetical protein
VVGTEIGVGLAIAAFGGLIILSEVAGDHGVGTCSMEILLDAAGDRSDSLGRQPDAARNPNSKSIKLAFATTGVHRELAIMVCKVAADSQIEIGLTSDRLPLVESLYRRRQSDNARARNKNR